eukprot:TRINITY_DN2138_c0_g1_i2.p1 TRINITY_DN2138_c0_g1~~TRINITY_DN2138_c0_g1_i2.p1  ORF type:complete len:231 (-),score=70.23 TRINITY_DN2138_c0_g1_i2:69-761(-)
MPRRKRTSDKPKRPLTAYMIFSQEKRGEIKQNNPDVSFGEVGKLLGQAWQKLSSDDRVPFENKSKEAKVRYQEELKKYKEDHPDSSDDEPPKKRLKGEKAKRKPKDKNAPKKPCSAFFWFSKEQRPLIKTKNPNATFGEMGKLVGEAWRNLVEADKQPYVKKATEDKNRYVIEMKNYKPPKVDSSSSSEESSSDSSSDSESNSDSSQSSSGEESRSGSSSESDSSEDDSS